MITVEEHLMGRDKEYPLTFEQAMNMAKQLSAVNYIRGRYGKPLKMSSGYRPGHYNKQAGGAENSSHLLNLADDFVDPPGLKISPSHPQFGHLCINGKSFRVGAFGLWCLENMDELEKAGLYMEHPAYTEGWVHLSTRSTTSGKRIFIPR